MSVQTFPTTIHLATPFDYEDRRDHSLLAYAGAPVTQLISWADREVREFSAISLVPLTNAERETVKDFFDSIDQFDPFYLLDDTEYQRTGIALVGDTDGVNKDFTPPVTGRGAGDFPYASYTVYDDGTPVTVSSLTVDTRTFTLAAAPANPSVMTADYDFKWLVQLVGGLRETPLAGSKWRIELPLREVVYVP